MNEKIRYFSMFTGVGGFELGLENTRANSTIQKGWEQAATSSKSLQKNRDSSSNPIFKCVGFSEIDKYANQLLSKRFPNITNYGDATKINPRELPDFDMLCGGFPCQAFSIAGKRRGFEDTRGTLFFEIARIIEVKRPKIVFLENVKGLLNHNKGETFKVIIQTLSELGYDVQWMVLNSKFFGVPQNRERVFIIGNLRGESRPEILPFRTSYEKIDGEYKMIGVAQQGSQAQRVYTTDIAPTLKGLGGGQGAKTGLFAIQSHSPRTNDPKKGGSGPLISAEHCFTIDSTPHLAHKDMRIRRLTPTECERLQGFPDGWTDGFSDTQRYKMMGNAVTVNVIKAIAKRLSKYE